MKKRMNPKFATASAAPAEVVPTKWLYILLTIACAAFLATGFFFAARQHFAAMDLGMKNSKLRKQVEEMESQSRQLTLAREIVRSPGEMKRIAVNKGFREKQGDLITVADKGSSTVNPLVERTSFVTSAADKKPVKAFFPMTVPAKAATNAKKEKAEKGKSIDPKLLAINSVR